jgi:LmbE family N-acetylglucosaminyl deacetylase
MPADRPPSGSAPSVLHLAPHPDDELIGAPATLMALRDAGWRVVNQACGLGSDPSRRAARAEELTEACHRAGFELRLPSGPAFAEIRPDGGELRTLIAAAIAEVRPAIVVSPGPADRHPAHERVAAAARAALEAWEGDAAPSPTPRWWTYDIWGSLAEPTLATAFDGERLAEITHALAAHAGELERADYRRLVHGRAEAAAVTAPQLLFGFGNDAAPAPPGGAPEYAELLREQIFSDGTWRSGEPRWLDPTAPLAP